jgi:hypothetical protein
VVAAGPKVLFLEPAGDTACAGSHSEAGTCHVLWYEMRWKMQFRPPSTHPESPALHFHLTVPIFRRDLLGPQVWSS